MHSRVDEKIKNIMKLEEKIRHVKIVPHTEANDATLKYF